MTPFLPPRCPSAPTSGWIDLNTVDYAGALHDPVAARVITVDMGPVVEAHNRFARQFAA